MTIPRLYLIAAMAAMCLPSAAQQTPPIAPKLQPAPLPPAVVLPGPEKAPPDVPNRPLTADEAARIALHNQPNIVAAAAEVTSAQGRTGQARSGLRPSLAVTSSYNKVQTIHTQGGGGGGGVAQTGGSNVTQTGFFGSASIHQLLFDFNHTRDLLREASASERAANQNLTRVQADTVLQVKQAFYTLAQNERLVAVNESNVRNQQDHLALAQARLNAGMGLPSDVVRAQTAVSDAIFNLNVARNNAAISRVDLATAMGVDPRTPIQVSDQDEPITSVTDVGQLVQSAQLKRPEVLQAQAGLLSARFAESAARNSNAPSLAATLALSSRGTDALPGTDQLNIGATLTWSPFDSGLTAGRVKEARGQVDAARAALGSTRLAVTSDVSQAYLNLRTAEQRVTTADAEVANAQEGARLAEGRYRAGLGTFIDVTDAQSALLTARTNRVNAQTAVNQARSALSRAIGAALPTTR